MPLYVDGANTNHFYFSGTWQKCQECLWGWARGAEYSQDYVCLSALFASPMLFINPPMTRYVTLGEPFDPCKVPRWFDKKMKSVINTPLATICNQFSKNPVAKSLKGLETLPLCFLLSEQSTPLQKLFLFLAYLEGIATNCSSRSKLPQTGDHDTFVSIKVAGLMPKVYFLSRNEPLTSTKGSTTASAQEFLTGIFSMILNFFPDLAGSKNNKFSEHWTTSPTAVAFFEPIRELLLKGVELCLSSFDTTIKNLGSCVDLLKPLIKEQQDKHFFIGTIIHEEGNFKKATSSADPNQYLSAEDEKKETTPVGELYISENYLLLNNGAQEGLVISLGVGRTEVPDGLYAKPHNIRVFNMESRFLPQSVIGSANRMAVVEQCLKLMFQVCPCGDSCEDPSHILRISEEKTEARTPLPTIHCFDQCHMEEPLTTESFRAALESCKRDLSEPEPALGAAKARKSKLWTALEEKAQTRNRATVPLQRNLTPEMDTVAPLAAEATGTAPKGAASSTAAGAGTTSVVAALSAAEVEKEDSSEADTASDDSSAPLPAVPLAPPAQAQVSASAMASLKSALSAKKMV